MQKWLQPSWVIWLFNFCILPIVCDQSTVYICITHKKHYILFTFSWSWQAQRGFISFNFYQRFAHEKFFSSNMRSVCTSNRSVPASSCHSDHSVSTWLLVAVKCPGITPTPPRAELTNAVRWGITQSTDCHSVKTPWQKDETSLRWARVWDRKEGALALKLLQVFWPSSPWMEQLSVPMQRQLRNVEAQPVW